MLREAGSSAALHLTFDDGPDPIWTPQVLDRLDHAGVTATFFVLGARVRAFPRLVAQIAQAGHTIGLHGDEHLDHSRSSVAAIRTDTDRALARLAAVGVAPALWRLPWGRLGPATGGIAAAHGLDIVGWDVDPHDWRGDGWDAQPPEVRAAPQTGGIVLLHDAIGPGAPRHDCLNTLELVGAMLLAAAQHGMPVQALGAPVPAADA